MNVRKINNFHGNVPTWIALADLQVDYFTQFIRAWIPFNAWFSNTYLHLNQDREIINEIKAKSNPIRDKISTIFRIDDKESKEFLALLSRFHYELEHNPIPCEEHRITLTKVITEKNKKATENIECLGYKIIVDYNASTQKGGQKVRTQLIELNGYKNLIDWDQNEWNSGELADYLKMGLKSIKKNKFELQKNIIDCYNNIDPYKPSNLILEPVKSKSKSTQPANSIVVDSENNLFFVDNVEEISKAIIEVLYCLRNVLFHGEINPTKEVQKIYKEAYFILSILIRVLN